MAGFASPPIVGAIARQAELGNHFLLPTAEAIEVCRLLTEQLGCPSGSSRSQPLARTLTPCGSPGSRLAVRWC